MTYLCQQNIDVIVANTLFISSHFASVMLFVSALWEGFLHFDVKGCFPPYFGDAYVAGKSGSLVVCGLFITFAKKIKLLVKA